MEGIGYRIITWDILTVVYRLKQNPLKGLCTSFIRWAKNDGGCWYWIEEGVEKCLSNFLYLEVNNDYMHFNLCSTLDINSIIEIFPFNTYFLVFPRVEEEYYKFFQYNLRKSILEYINKNIDLRNEILFLYDTLTYLK